MSRLLALAVLAAVGLVPPAAMPAAAVSAATRVVGWDTYRRLDVLPYLPADAVR